VYAGFSDGFTARYAIRIVRPVETAVLPGSNAFLLRHRPSAMVFHPEVFAEVERQLGP
jgi:hypothetical protein